MIRIIAVIEISIGAITIVGITGQSILSASSKPVPVYIFVMISAVASTLLGAGLLMRREWGRYYLIFFSGYVILTKILVFTGLLEFRGEIITTPPSWFKNIISVAYHTAIIVFLSNERTRREFY
jgi:hypothetical protein